MHARQILIMQTVPCGAVPCRAGTGKLCHVNGVIHNIISMMELLSTHPLEIWGGGLILRAETPTCCEMELLLLAILLGNGSGGSGGGEGGGGGGAPGARALRPST